MKKIGMILCALVLGSSAFAQNITEDAYHFKVNLNKVYEDKIQVELKAPKIESKTIKYNMPKIVPGTYSIYNFGRFATDLKAYAANGKELKVNRSGKNSWLIKKAKKLDKITYWVEDSWDTEQKNIPFEPAGTNFETEKNFMFNNHGIFGYFDGKLRQPFFVEVDRPEKFFGATSMPRVGGDADTDIFEIGNYNDLIDAPIMFCEPDTAVLKVANADVLISVYSPEGKVTAEFLKGEIGPILMAQKDYLGGVLPVDNYAFILYLDNDMAGGSGGFGALEHSYSSVYYLPEWDADQIAGIVRDVAAHEFFHIVTPLNIHSREIHDFDFLEPEMSEHLWMYEGVTEYAAGHVQAKYGLISIEDYLKIIAEKVRGAEKFNETISFTEMSSLCLDKHKDEYLNVYQKGALIGMCLDLMINELSDGRKDLQGLMNDLSKEYGKDKPFEDEELFGKITELTYPEIGKFLNEHVGGTKALPLQELLETVGITYLPVGMVKEMTIGGLDQAMGVNAKGKFFIADTDKLDDFGKSIGLQEGDVLEKWNGKELSLTTINDVMGEFFMSATEGKEFNVEVARDEKPQVLNAKVIFPEVEQQHAFSLNESPSAEQMKLRKAWLDEYVLEADMENK